MEMSTLLENLEVAKYNLESVIKLMQEYIEIDQEELRTNEDKKMLEHYSYMLAHRQGQKASAQASLDLLNQALRGELVK